MAGKHIQIYSVYISPKYICKSKQKFKVNVFTTPRQNSLPGPNHRLSPLP